MAELRQADYERLLAFRTALRQFLRWSEGEAKSAGLTPAQHQLLLAVRGHPHQTGPTIGELSQYLVSRHHSVVELVDRAAAAGLVKREREDEDHRLVRVHLTTDGERRIAELSLLHLEELRRLAPVLGRPADAPYRGPARRPDEAAG
ncbi:MAG TPA: MarR family winged helix-turn-helix transcriptional regulator [Solirubrobacterales bacterium]|jgi:DNA-binding MarR family transcriptional regulator